MRLYSEPLISVITPCYQHGHLLSEALNSALTQTNQSLEVVVIDDGSTDNTQEVARSFAQRYPGKLVLIAQNNRGQAHARQAGLDAARGKYLVLLDADDCLEPTMVERCLATFTKHPRAAAVIGDAWLTSKTGQKLRYWPQRRICGWPDILNNNPYGALAATMIRKTAVRAVGGLAVSGIPGTEDWDLWSRLVRAGFKFALVGHGIACYRQTTTSYSRQAIRMLDSTIEMLDRCAIKDPRLSHLARHWPVAPPISDPLHSFYHNNKVFKALGLVLSVEPQFLTVSGQILNRLRPGKLSVRHCSDQLLEGYHYGLSGGGAGRNWDQTEVTALIEQLLAALTDKGLEAYGPALIRELSKTINQPLRKRSFLARLSERMNQR